MRRNIKRFATALTLVLAVDIPAMTTPERSASAFGLELGPFGFHLGGSRSRGHRRYRSSYTARRRNTAPDGQTAQAPPAQDAAPPVPRAAAAGAIAGAVAGASFQGFRPGGQADGFDRNRFAGADDWNNWASRSWGVGWNQWGAGWGYWAGPVFWPFAYGDAISYALWPGATYDPFFVDGPDFLLTGILWPGPYDDQGRHVVQGKGVAPDCGGVAPNVVDLPIDQIDQAIRPAPDQKAMLRDLKKASDDAKTTLAASCPGESPATVIGRLDAVGARLIAIRQALGTIEAPLTKLYNSLDDQQRSRLAGLGEAGGSADRAQTEGGKTDQVKTNATLVDFCEKQASHFSLLPINRMETIVRPTDAQRPEVEALKSTAAMAASELTISCPSTLPKGIAGRLDVVLKRIDALSVAVQEIRPPLKKLYASLDDDQKARLDVVGAVSNKSDQTEPPPKT